MGLIDWSIFDRGEAERLADEGHLVFVDVTADWCFTCKVNERLALETEEVATTFERHQVVAMKADWTNRSQPIADFLADHGRYGIPFYLLYRPHREPHLFGELITSRKWCASSRRPATSWRRAGRRRLTRRRSGRGGRLAPPARRARRTAIRCHTFTAHRRATADGP